MKKANRFPICLSILDKAEYITFNIYHEHFPLPGIFFNEKDLL